MKNLKLVGIKASIYGVFTTLKSTPLTLDKLMEHLPEGTKRNTVSKSVGLMVKDSIIVKNDDKTYQLPKEEKKAAKAAPKGKGDAKKPAAKKPAAPKKETTRKNEKHDYSKCNIKIGDKVSFTLKGRGDTERNGSVIKVYFFKPQECFYCHVKKTGAAIDGKTVFDKRVKNVKNVIKN